MATTHAHLFSFFGLQQNPFQVSPDLRVYFSIPARESILSELLFAIQTRQGLMVLTGEAGSGKTTLLHKLLGTLRSRRVSSSYLFHSRLDPDDLFQFILRDFGVPCSSQRKSDVLQLLYQWLFDRHAAGDSPVIVLDEAHGLPTGTLDELRLLLNLESPDGKLVQIVLAGQVELEEQLRGPALRQLWQRVMFRRRLPLLDPLETSAYIRSRLAHGGLHHPGLFPPETITAIYRHSQGIPRTINLLGEHALINAYAGQKHTISPEDIHSIAGDFDLVENPLSLEIDESLANKQRELDFSSLVLEPDSVDALRQEFPTAQTTRAMVLEQAPPLHTQPNLSPALTSAAGSAAGVSIASDLAKSAEGSNSASLSLQEPFPTATAVQGGVRQMRQKSRFVAYWKDVASSFRRDVLAFQADLATLVGRKIRSRSGGSSR